MSGLAPALVVAILLALAALAACVRLFYQYHRGARSGGIHLALLLLAQPLLAGLLYLGLFAPLRPTHDDTLTVLTAGWEEAPATTVAGARVVLPEAREHADAEAVPDLATALRRHPHAAHLQVIGGGLEARDLDAARGLALDFDAAPAPVGLVQLTAPTQVAAGDSFSVRGRVAGMPDAVVELHDPAGQRVQRTTIDADGHFLLHGTARAAGVTDYTLQVSDAHESVREALPLPLLVIEPKPIRLLLLAGAPGPELKYLRRWARDAGVELHSRIDAGAGLALGDAALAIDAANLRRFDAVLLDVRSLRTLGAAALQALTASVREGLGVLLRIDAPLSAVDRERLRGWGFGLDGGTGTALVQLADAAATEPLPVLTRRQLAVTADDTVPLARDAHGQPFGWWRALGRGRIGLMTLTDSFQLVLTGHAGRHATLWSAAFAKIARPLDAAASPSLPWPIWQGERAALCGLDDGAEVITPTGKRTALPIDPATGARRCAAFWPQQHGWHVLQAGAAQIPFAVLADDAGKALRAQRRLDTTHALAAAAASAPRESARSLQPGAAWPWLLAWLALAALVWMLERRRPPELARTRERA